MIILDYVTMPWLRLPTNVRRAPLVFEFIASKWNRVRDVFDIVLEPIREWCVKILFLDLACGDHGFLLRCVPFGRFIFQQTEKPFRWFVNLVRKSLDKFPDASVDRFRMKVVI